MTNSASNSAIVTGASGGIGGSIAKTTGKRWIFGGRELRWKTGPSTCSCRRSQGLRGDRASRASRCGDCRRRGAALQRVDGRFRRTRCGGSLLRASCRSFDASGDVAAFDKVIATNLRGTFLVFAQAVNMFSMAAASWLSPAVFSPSPSRLTVPTSLPRRESRGGSRTCQRIARPKTSRFNAVAPGQVLTDLFLKGKSDARIDELKR